MNECLTVRPARPDELDQVGRLTLEAYVADGMVDPAGAYAVPLADAAGRAADAELLVAADSDGTLLGTVTVCQPGSPLSEVSRPGELEFRMLAVAPQARRRGVGAILVNAVLQRASDLGAHRVVMCSAELMHTAHRLYTRLGFARLPERDWQPVPGLQLLAFGRAVAGRLTKDGLDSVRGIGVEVDLTRLRHDHISEW
ncbi:MAG: GNAT family N-acetyltransferase [Pseudonocardiaceae bacterium]